MNKKPLKALRNNMPSVKAYVEAIKNNQHVVPSSSGWNVKKPGSSRATKSFDTQKEAIAFARKLAIKQEAELFIHGKNGQIRERNSYGSDVFPPKG